MTTFFGNPLASMACLKKEAAAASSQRSESKKSTVSPNLSMARYK
jgi:hypothetical protein